MKKIILLLILISSLVLKACWWEENDVDLNKLIQNIEDQDNNIVQIYYFWWDGCLACAEQNKFWEEVEQDYDKININKFEVWSSRKNSILFNHIWSELWVRVTWVPWIFIWSTWFSWVTKDEVLQKIDKCLSKWCEDKVFDIIKDYK